jgi:TolB protein
MAKFTPDGSHIVFGADPGMGTPVLCSMKTDGSEVHQYTSDLILAGPATVGTDGRMVFSAIGQDARFDLYSADLDSDAAPQKLEDSGFAISPQLSPDGAHIAFVGEAPDDTLQIFESNADGSGAHAVTHEGHINAAPAYSPDGKSLIYVSDVDGKSEVCKIAVGENR